MRNRYVEGKVVGKRGPKDDAAVRIGEQYTHRLKVSDPAPRLFDVFRPGEQRDEAVGAITPRPDSTVRPSTERNFCWRARADPALD